MAMLLIVPLRTNAGQEIIQGQGSADYDEPRTTNTGAMFPDATAAATEHWEFVLDNGQGNGECTFVKTVTGTVQASGNWVYTYKGSMSLGTFTEAPVTISGKTILITATGTATSPSAPPGYNTSPYALTISGTGFNGQGSGPFTITYQTPGWPPSITGVWEGTRISGSGITGEEPEGIRYMPWIFLLLKE